MDRVDKPCQKCGSTDYDQCDTSDECLYYDESGRLILDPKTCDQCSLEWLDSKSDKLH